jgi:hypothetical protein
MVSSIFFGLPGKGLSGKKTPTMEYAAKDGVPVRAAEPGGAPICVCRPGPAIGYAWARNEPSFSIVGTTDAATPRS